MDIEEFAGFILRNPNIKDKIAIRFEETLTGKNTHETCVLSAIPDQPARPAYLKWKNPLKGSHAYPRLPELVDPVKRGLVLHYFANHELLAMELMALALLKFPHAPYSFKQGLIKTIHEEQEHLSLYLARMNELGVAFGDIPVNDFFWRHIASMRSPLDFVVRMSLTFEQANLDFSFYYKEIFAKLEDSITSLLLAKVLADEIGHVKHGVIWFNRWQTSSPAHTEQWQSYCELLPFPLNPSRAKGPVFCRKERLEAGLTPHFVEQLELYQSSKSRPPSVWFFNPGFEDELVANSPGYSSNKSVAQMASDLTPLLAFLCSRFDVVLCAYPPSASFCQSLNRLAIGLPEFVRLSNQQPVIKNLKHHKISSLKPWGWSPKSYRQLQPFASRLTTEDVPLHEWLKSNNFAARPYRKVASKLWSHQLAKDCLLHVPGLKAYAPNPEPPQIPCYSLSEISQAMHHLLVLGYEKCVLKAPYGASGRGLFVSSDPEHSSKTQLLWLQRLLQKQPSILVEPWLRKVCDLSLLLQIERDRSLFFKGCSFFLTDEQGAYRGHLLGNMKSLLPASLKKFLWQPNEEGDCLYNLLPQLAQHVGNKLLAEGYVGPAGIDTLIYSSSPAWDEAENSKQYHFRPLVEVNPRYTMGHIALNLEKKLSPQRLGVWLHVPIKELNSRRKDQALPDFCQNLAKRYPLQLSPSSPPTIDEGCMWTNDAATAKSLLTVLTVGRELAECCKILSSLVDPASLPLLPR